MPELTGCSTSRSPRGWGRSPWSSVLSPEGDSLLLVSVLYVSHHRKKQTLGLNLWLDSYIKYVIIAIKGQVEISASRVATLAVFFAISLRNKLPPNLMGWEERPAQPRPQNSPSATPSPPLRSENWGVPADPSLHHSPRVVGTRRKLVLVTHTSTTATQVTDTGRESGQGSPPRPGRARAPPHPEVGRMLVAAQRLLVCHRMEVFYSRGGTCVAPTSTLPPQMLLADTSPASWQPCLGSPGSLVAQQSGPCHLPALSPAVPEILLTASPPPLLFGPLSPALTAPGSPPPTTARPLFSG